MSEETIELVPTSEGSFTFSLVARQTHKLSMRAYVFDCSLILILEGARPATLSVNGKKCFIENDPWRIVNITEKIKVLPGAKNEIKVTYPEESSGGQIKAKLVYFSP